MSLARYACALLYKVDLWTVRACAASVRGSLVRNFAVGLSRAGDGSLYLILGVLVVAMGGRQGFGAVLVAALSNGILHAGYPWLKKQVARPRPYHIHDDLTPLHTPLDRYSFPSGHAMTLTAALVPFGIIFPEHVGLLFILWGLMLWSRLACAHHYLSDVLVGALMGFCVAYPLSELAVSQLAVGAVVNHP